MFDHTFDHRQESAVHTMETENLRNRDDHRSGRAEFPGRLRSAGSRADERDVLLLLAKFIGMAVLTVVAMAVRTHRAHRRRAEVQTGGSATCRGLLSTGDERFRGGVLLLSGARVVWQSRRGDAALELSGAQVLAAGEASGRRAQAGDVQLRLLLPGRVPARLVVQEDDASTLVDLLARTEPPPAGTPLPPLPPPRRRLWAVIALALAGAWTAAWVLLVLDGDTVTATVTGGDGAGLCSVAWIGDDGRPHTNREVDCDDPPKGTALPVWALGWPATGDVENPDDMIVGVGLVALVIAAPGAVSLIRTRRRQRRAAQQPVQVGLGETAAPRVDVPVLEAPALSADELRPLPHETPGDTLRRLAPRAVRQIPLEGWENPGLPDGGGIPQLLPRLLRAVAGPGALLVAAVVLAWSVSGSWYVLATAATNTGAGVSTGEVASDAHWPLPGMVSVRFATSDRGVQLADVATSQSLPAGRPVTVEYAVTDPGSARLVGPADALGRAVGVTLTGGGVVLLWLLRRARSAVGGLRAVRTSAERPPNPALGLLTADSGGRPLLLACSPFTAPLELYAVPLEAPLPHGTVARFVAEPVPELRLRGRLAHGETVVPEVGGVPLWPAGPAWRPEPEELVTLLDSVGALGREETAD